MQQPWGLSGPQFLVGYSVAFGAAVLLVIGPRLVLGRRARGRLTPYQAAFLLGGTGRVLLAGSYDLLASGHVHRSRDGRLTTEHDFAARDPLQGAIAGIMSVSAKWPERVARLNRDPAMNDLRAELRVSGLLRTRAGGFWRLVVLLLPAAVWIVGLVRVINGAVLHRPITDLVLLLLLSAIVGVVVLVATPRHGLRTTSKGAALLGRMRGRYRADRKASNGRGGTSLELTGIALLGIGAAGVGMLSLVGAAAKGSAGMGGHSWLTVSPRGGGGYGGGGCGGSCGGGGGGCGGGGCGGGGCGG